MGRRLPQSQMKGLRTRRSTTADVQRHHGPPGNRSGKNSRPQHCFGDCVVKGRRNVPPSQTAGAIENRKIFLRTGCSKKTQPAGYGVRWRWPSARHLPTRSRLAPTLRVEVHAQGPVARSLTPRRAAFFSSVLFRYTFPISAHAMRSQKTESLFGVRSSRVVVPRRRDEQSALERCPFQGGRLPRGGVGA